MFRLCFIMDSISFFFALNSAKKNGSGNMN